MKMMHALSAIAAALLMISLSGCDGAQPTNPTSTLGLNTPIPATITTSPTTIVATPNPSPSTDTSVHSFVLVHTDFSSIDPVGQQPGNNFVGAVIASVLIMVKGDRVAAVPCGTQAGVDDPGTCDGYFTTISMGDPQSDSIWIGTRNGTTAVVNGSDKFMWATITFSGDASSAPPVHFEMATGCLAVDGTQGERVPTVGCH